VASMAAAGGVSPTLTSSLASGSCTNYEKWLAPGLGATAGTLQVSVNPDPSHCGAVTAGALMVQTADTNSQATATGPNDRGLVDYAHAARRRWVPCHTRRRRMRYEIRDALHAMHARDDASERAALNWLVMYQSVPTCSRRDAETALAASRSARSWTSPWSGPFGSDRIGLLNWRFQPVVATPQSWRCLWDDLRGGCRS